MQAILAPSSPYGKPFLPILVQVRIASKGSMSERLGKALREARKRAGLTQMQVAAQIGVTRAAVGLWESTGQVATDNLIRLCAVLGIEVQSAVDGVARPEIWLDKFSEAKKRLGELAIRLDAMRPSYTIAAKASEHPAHVLTRGESQPVYIIRPTQSGEGNIQMSKKPAFLVKREERFGRDQGLYLAAIGSDILEPAISSRSFAIVSPWALAEVGNLVLVIPPQDIKKTSLNIFEPIEFQNAWLGELRSITAAAIVIRQYKPENDITIELDRIGVMHAIYADL